LQAAIPKQYLELKGQPIATYSLQTFAAMPQVLCCPPALRSCGLACLLWCLLALGALRHSKAAALGRTADGRLLAAWNSLAVPAACPAGNDRLMPLDLSRRSAKSLLSASQTGGEWATALTGLDWMLLLYLWRAGCC
jgi:hypothetical protein